MFPQARVHAVVILTLFALLCTPFVLATQPQAPVWLEPGLNKTNVDGYDFHIHVYPMIDAENDPHVATDFEIWDVAANQRVWSALHSTDILLHIHNANGVFEGNLLTQDRLKYNTTYRVRARFYTNTSTQNISDWSEWREFRTKPQITFNNSPFLWTAREGYTVDLVAENITTPVNVKVAPNLYEHLPENERPLLYVSQLYGKLGMIRRDGTYVPYATNLLNYDSFGVLPGSGETGVTGLYVDPVSGDLYASMVYCKNQPCSGPTDALAGKVVRFTTNDNGDGYTQQTTILDSLPVAPSHQVQSITRGPDGKLYLNTGDADTTMAQNLSFLAGKILRFNEDGSIPADNPFPGKYVYAAGFRNPFGAAWRPGTNELWVTNNGPDEDDGIFRVLPGSIFGWCCSTAQGTWHVWRETVAPVQLAFDSGTSGFPAASTGTFYVALSGSTYSEGPSVTSKRITQFRLNPDGTKESLEDLVTYSGPGFGAPIGLDFGSEGLYFADIYGEEGFVGIGETRGNIYLVHPGNQTVTNQTINFRAALGPKAWYPQGLNMIWECKGTGGSGNYRYDFFFGDGQSQQNVNVDNVWYTYPANGTYKASCTIHDLTTGKNASTNTTLILGTVAPSGVQNISFTTTPAGAAVSIAEPLNQTFSYTLSNPSSLSTTTQWIQNGVVQTSTGSTYNFIGNYSAAGNYNVTVIVNSSQNTIRKEWALTVSDSTPSNGSGTNTSSCVTNVVAMPLSCTGGSVTSDTNSGSCRTIVCSGSGNSLQILACDKPDSGTAQYFEMYRQTATGSGVKICLGTSCMQNEGYLKSPNYPFCSAPPAVQNISFTTTPAGSTVNIVETANQAFSYTLTNPSGLSTSTQWLLNGVMQGTGTGFTFIGNTSASGTYNVTVIVTSSQNTIRKEWTLFAADSPTGGGGGGSCATTVVNVPVSCTGGSVTSDTNSGSCRTIVCSGSGNSLQIMACNKPDGAAAQYFEMYRQTTTGSGVKICLGTSCMQNEGYVKSANFPICTNGTNSTVQNISFSTTPSASSLAIAEPANQAFSYVLSNPSSLATSTQWLLNSVPQSASASSYLFVGNYSAAGSYNVTVIVTSSQNTIRKEWTLTVSDTVVNATCVNTVASALSSCTGGTVTSDTTSGSCRTVICTNGADSLKVMACNKPDGAAAQYFEMYKQQQTGSSVSKICLGSTCIQDNGYARSANYPICG